MSRRTFFWLLSIAVGIAFVTGMFVVNRATLATTKDCISPSNQAECSEAKMTRIAIEDTMMVETAKAIPTYTPDPIGLTPLPDYSPPLPTFVIQQLTGESLTSIQFHNATSVWRVGSIKSSVPSEGAGIFVLSRPPLDKAPSYLAYTFGGAPISKEDQEKYTSYWLAPRDIGEIFITNVTGIDGIVSFKTSTGVTGTFDLAKGVWSFD